MIKIQCKSVAGGWQTCVVDTDYVFGPVFNRIQDLWNWQSVHMYSLKECV